MAGAPDILAFVPYTAAGIADIIRARLATLGRQYSALLSASDNGNSNNGTKQQQDGPVLMQAAAVEFCARKAAVAGDLRKALDLCRQSVEVAEVEWRAKVRALMDSDNQQKENVDASDNKDNAAIPVPRVTVQHMLKVVNSVYGAANPSVLKIRLLNA